MPGTGASPGRGTGEFPCPSGLVQPAAKWRSIGTAAELEERSGQKADRSAPAGCRSVLIGLPMRRQDEAVAGCL